MIPARYENVSLSRNSPSVILVNAIIFSVIGILREDPLSMGILDVFFFKISDHLSLKLRESL
jgi:hypothetical protein